MKKRIITTVIAICSVISLTACGNTNISMEQGTSEKDNGTLESMLVENTWMAVLNYDNSGGNRVMKFEEDGTGIITRGNGAGGETTWKCDDKGVYVTYTGTNSLTGGQYTQDMEFDLVKNDNSVRLVDDENNYVYVPKDNFEFETENLKHEYEEIAEVLDWEKAIDVKLSNEAKYKKQYCGKIYKWTAEVVDIGSIYCQMTNGYYKGLPANSINVYLSEDDLVELSKNQTVTIIGRLYEYSNNIHDAFVVK